jgi:copper/silver efflux system protein
MIARLIAWSISRRGLVAAFALALLIAGSLYVRSTPVDAIPDLSDVQVIVYTDYPGQAPQVVENQVTYPLVTALLGVPNTKVVRGQSMFSSSFVYVIFKEGTNLYWARSRVLERLNSVQSKLPAGAKTELGPDATGVGWVYQYAVEAPGYSPAQLRTIQDFQVRYALQGVPGVAEVASIGGFVRQYQVLLDPARLRAFGITARQIVEAVRAANQDVGARTVEVAGSDYAIRGLGYFRGMNDITDVAVGAGTGGRPILVGDVAQVTIGPDLRTGIAERNGQGEAVGGVVVMRVGANALDVVGRVKAKLAELAPSLPPGVHVVTTYDRTDLIHRSIATLFRTLIEESVIVGLVCVLFLLHARSALVAIATLPLGILAALILIRWMGINANIMSLGGIAIAIGAMIDAAIVMIENLHKHLERAERRYGGTAVTSSGTTTAPSQDSGQVLPPYRRTAEDHWRLVSKAAIEVGPALFMSLLIITLSFLPVFTLEDQEGRLFRPLALTKTFAMAAAALLSVTVVPVLMGFLIKGRIRPEAVNPLNRWAARVYRPVLHWSLRARVLVIVGAVAAFALTLLPFASLGSEFMPPLREGSLMYMPNTLPSVSLTQQRRLLHVQDSILMTFPEVESVWGKAGRANTATDWAPISMVETTVNLKAPAEWRPGMTQDGLIADMDRALRITGAVNSWTMPIKNRTDMLSTGIRTTLGIKIYGPDLEVIQRIGHDIEGALSGMRGTGSIYAERSFGGRYLDIRPKADALARYGLTTGDAQEVLGMALGGDLVTTTVEGRERFPVQVRYAREFRDSPEAIGRLLVSSEDGIQVPLAQVADINFAAGAPMIRSENGYLNDLVSIDVRGRDVGGYVADAKQVVAREVKIPPGYRLEWSGQYEALERVKDRLAVVLPLTLAVIALLLYLTFGSLVETGIVMLSLPFALIGGVWAMWLLDYNLSIAVAVGFIALAGVAAETGVVMLLYLDHAWQDITRDERRPSLGELVTAIEYGAVNRLRPKLMTVAAIMLGLLPALWSHGTGAEVMQRIAAPMVGGMVTSTILTLVVIPALYYLWRRRGLEEELGHSSGNRTLVTE